MSIRGHAMEETQSSEDSNQFSHFVVKLFLVTGLALVLFLVWRASEIFLLVFAGILLAIFLQTFSKMISRIFHVSYPVALTLLILSLITTSISLLRLFAPTLSSQAALLTEEMPRAFNFLQDAVDRHIPSSKETVQAVFANFNLVEQVTSIFSMTMGAITGLILFLFVGIYLAYDYPLYINGFLKLIPMGKRAKTEKVLSACGETLRWWLVGQLIAMLLLGVAIFVGLYFLEMPLAFILALLAGLLTFLPTLGPILSAVPAILVALIQGPLQAAYVVALYIGIQIVECYFVTPFIQKQTTALPPALVIVVQILLGILAGVLGLALAAPLTAVSIVLVNQLYVKEIIEKQ
ncbi:hypothetical protein PHSC3_001433 [Chlamydiales bacterium STE3]|nr:hypothetical protein PHSC3_001433 [Chlamydiales bacterium STE3]